MFEFIKKNKCLFGIFLLAVYLIIKNSSVPYLFTPPYIISLIFDVPTRGPFSSLIPIVDIFTTSYVISLIFYVFIEYIPTVKREHSALIIVAPQLLSLHLYMSELLEMIRYSANISIPLNHEKKKAIDALDFGKNNVTCNKITIIDGIAGKPAITTYCLLKDCDLYRNLILETCKKICEVPSFFYCNKELQNVLSEIQISHLLNQIPKQTDPLYNLSNIQFTNSNFGDGFELLQELKVKIGKFAPKKIEYSMSDATQDEINNWKQKNIKFIHEYPEVLEVVRAIQKD
jgi:hypothetical protein